MARKDWKHPTDEERAEHVETLERLGRLVIDRCRPIAVWFVLLSGFGPDSASQYRDRAS